MKKTMILLLCSDPLMRSVMQEVLEDAGHNVDATGDLGVAVDRLKVHSPDLLIVRPYVESITGHDAAHYLRTKQHGLRVLLVGGILNDKRLLYREELQAFEVFPPPYTREQLVKKVEQVLAGHPRRDDEPAIPS